MPLPLDVKAEMQLREEALKAEHQEYLQVHPEVELLMQDFISAALVEQPVDVFDFARGFFASGPSATAAPDAEYETGGAGAAETTSQQANDVDVGDQDQDLDDMLEGTNTELMAYLKTVFESIDNDSSGTLSKAELKSKLAADDELQQLLGLAGGETWSIITQLDGDGDGEITWMEFEQMITGGLE